MALDVTTGKLKWHYQTTPHDEWDWDAVEPVVLVDANWQGQPRKLLLQANRNGFFYVLDRTDGKLLLAKPMVKKLTWAKEIGADGRPVMNPNQTPTREGTLICPAVEGAANFFSTSFNPATGLFYVNTLEKCNIYTKTPAAVAGRPRLWRRRTAPAPDDTGAEDSSRLRHSDRQSRLGTAAGRGRRDVERNALHGQRAGLLRRRWRRTGRGGRRHRQKALEFSLYRVAAHVPYDLHV